MKKLKAVFISWISIYPTITLLLYGLGEQLNALPLLGRTLVLTLLLVPLMAYVLVPFWTWVLNSWLVFWTDFRADASAENKKIKSTQNC